MKKVRENAGIRNFLSILIFTINGGINNHHLMGIWNCLAFSAISCNVLYTK